MSGRTIKAVVAALGVIGIGLSIVGFYADKGESFPRVERILAPNCAAEQSAIAFLIAHKSIDATNPDFAALASLIEPKIATANPSIPRGRIKLEGVKVTTAALVFGGVAPTLTSNVEMQFLGDPKPVQGTLMPYQKAADDLCERSNLEWSVWPFWIGVALALLATLAALFSG